MKKSLIVIVALLFTICSFAQTKISVVDKGIIMSANKNNDSVHFHGHTMSFDHKHHSHKHMFRSDTIGWVNIDTLTSDINTNSVYHLYMTIVINGKDTAYDFKNVTVSNANGYMAVLAIHGNTVDQSKWKDQHIQWDIIADRRKNKIYVIVYNYKNKFQWHLDKNII